MPEESSIIARHVRAYYEWYREKLADSEMTLPRFDDLTSEQITEWTLFYASTVEVAGRASSALSVAAPAGPPR